MSTFQATLHSMTHSGSWKRYVKLHLQGSLENLYIRIGGPENGERAAANVCYHSSRKCKFGIVSKTKKG